MNRDRLFLNAAVNLHVASCRIVRAELTRSYWPIRRTIVAEYRCIREQLGYSESFFSSELARIARKKLDWK